MSVISLVISSFTYGRKMKNKRKQVNHKCTKFIYLIKDRNNIDGDSNQRSLSLRSCRSSRSRLSSSRSRSLSRSRSRSRSLSLSRSRSFRFAATATKKTLILKLKYVIFSRASAKAERGLSSLSCVWMYVDQNQGTPPPQEMAYPLGIPWFQVRIWIHHKNLS